MNANNDKALVTGMPGHGETALTKAGPKPERKLIDSLTNYSSREISKTLPEKAFIPMMALQKSLTVAVAATASTVTQVIATHGETTTNKLICAVLKLYNDGLNTTLQMTANQLFEYAMVWADTFPNETVKDLILCLKRAKSGQYGTDYNRVDGTVVSRFFRAYLDEKAQWLEDKSNRAKGDLLQQAKDTSLLKSLPADQQKALGELIKRPELRSTRTPDMASLSGYVEWLDRNVEDISYEDLEFNEKRGTEQNIEIVVQMVQKEKQRRRSLPAGQSE